jgi:acyl-CoA thioester hydrolase
VKIRIYYEDTDAGGIVYHTNYIKYCERARSEIFFEKGMMPLDGDSSGFVVKNLNADFLGFAVLGDMIEVTTEVIEKKTASVLLKHQIFKGEKKIFNMTILLVFVRGGKPKPIPTTLHNIFKEDKIFR